MRQIPLDNVFSRIFRRNKKRAVPTEQSALVHNTPPDDPPTPIAEPAPTTNTSVESDVPQSPQSDNSLNVATLEFAASRDLATFLEHDWPSVKQNDPLEFPAFEYLLHQQQQQQQPATPEPPEDQRPATSSGRSKPMFGTLPKKPKHLSLNRPKAAIAMIKRVRSTPNFRQT